MRKETRIVGEINMFKRFQYKIQMSVLVVFFFSALLVLSSFQGLRLYFLSNRLSSENIALFWKNNLMKTDLEKIMQYKEEILKWQQDWYKPLLEQQMYKHTDITNYSEEKIKRITELEKDISTILEKYHSSS